MLPLTEKVLEKCPQLPSLPFESPVQLLSSCLPRRCPLLAALSPAEAQLTPSPGLWVQPGPALSPLYGGLSMAFWLQACCFLLLVLESEKVTVKVPCDSGHARRLPGLLPLALLWFHQHWRNCLVNFSGKFKKQAKIKPAFYGWSTLHWPGSGCLNFRQDCRDETKKTGRNPTLSALASDWTGT